MFNPNGNVGIGTTSPGSALEINGQIKITGGTPGVSKVLTSDGVGLASWVTPSVGSIDNFTLKTVSGTTKVADWIVDDIMLLGFKMAVNSSLTVYNMVDGIMDQFENSGGVATATNASYDSTSKLYTNAGSGISGNIVTGGTATGDSSYISGSTTPAVAFDNSTATGWVVTQNTWPHWAQYDFGSGNAKTVIQYAIISQNGETPNSWTFSGSNDGSSYTTLDTQSGLINSGWTCGTDPCTTRSFSISNSTAYRYYKINITSGNTTDFRIYELQMMTSTTPLDMTITSTASTAVAAPSTARLDLFEEDIDSITVNTDIQGYVSSNNGTTWNQIILTNQGNYQSGRRILSGSGTITGAGSQMLWQVHSFNNKRLNLRGVGLTWN